MNNEPIYENVPLRNEEYVDPSTLNNFKSYTESKRLGESSLLKIMNRNKSNNTLLISLMSNLGKQFHQEIDFFDSNLDQLSKSDVNYLVSLLINLELENMRLLKKNKPRRKIKNRIREILCCCRQM